MGCTIREVSSVTHLQGLIEGHFEAKVELLHVAFFMGDADIVPGGLHAVVLHEILVAYGLVLRGFTFHEVLLLELGTCSGPWR
jgi:hypothetical protein